MFCGADDSPAPAAMVGRLLGPPPLAAVPSQYQLGYLFDPSFTKVVAIRKEKPAWMAGMWNGVGGHIEGVEEPTVAMMREFQEKTGLEPRFQGWWRRVAQVQGDDYVMHVFGSTSPDLDMVRDMTREMVRVRYVQNVVNDDNGMRLWLLSLTRDQLRGTDPYRNVVYSIRHPSYPLSIG